MDRLNNKYSIETFGCKVNSYDSGLLQKRLVKSGYKEENKEPSVFILNTCAVTEEATKEAIRKIRKIKSKNPKATVVVTGCGAQVDTDKFSDLPGADLVIANSHKGDMESILEKHFLGTLDQRVFKSNIFKKEDLEAGGGLDSLHTRSFLKIQDGCNSFCTYCVIPFARGKSRSIPMDQLIDRVNELHEGGVQEVVLTGVHIGDYEDSTQGKVLEDLMEQMLLKTKVPRFRMTSFEPVEINERLVDIYQDERFCPHFHMSIQSAQSKILQDMKRNYSAQDVEWSLNYIHQRVPHAFVGMDVIVGFPGETDEEYKETHQRLKDLPWTRIHVFPYSERPGTYANRLQGKLYRHDIMDRAKHLRELSSERYAKEALKQVGTVKKAMILNSNEEDVFKGLTRDFWNVSFKDSQSRGAGQETLVKITGFDHSHESRMDGLLVGEALQIDP